MSHIDSKEIEQFSKEAIHWWNEDGPLKGLHTLNPVRLEFIKQHLCRHFSQNVKNKKPFEGLKFIDIGCGAGLLSEPLKRWGAEVTGVDASREAIHAARVHAQHMNLEIEYLNCDLKELIKKGHTYDAVLSLEVVEHVVNIQSFLKECSQLLKPNGALVLSTLNKTWKSWALGIVVAENLLQWAPKGAHDWNKFISPQDLAGRLREVGVETLAVDGMTFYPLRGWRLGPDTDINYILYGTKESMRPPHLSCLP